MRDADVPANEVNEESLAAAFREILFDDVAGLLLEGFVAGVQTPALRRVPKENSGHAGSRRTTVRSAQMFHLDFSAGDDIFRECITSVGSIRRLRERHCRVHNAGILRATEHSANFFRETRANGGNELTGNREEIDRKSVV